MSRLTELLADLEKEFSQGNRLERELSRADVDTSDLIKNDPLLLEGLLTAGTLPIAGASAVKYAVGNKQLPSWLAPFTSRFGSNEMGLLKTRSGSGVGTDVVGRSPMPISKTSITTNRGPRGPINIEQPTQLPLPLRGGRNTGGVSETDKAMIKMQQSQQGIMNTPAALKSSPRKPLKSREEIRQEKKLRNLRTEQSQLRSYANMVNSMRQQGEATQDQMRNLERVTARLNFLNKILK